VLQRLIGCQPMRWLQLTTNPKVRLSSWKAGLRFGQAVDGRCRRARPREYWTAQQVEWPLRHRPARASTHGRV